jgi:hypothetical protein
LTRTASSRRRALQIKQGARSREHGAEDREEQGAGAVASIGFVK